MTVFTLAACLCGALGCSNNLPTQTYDLGQQKVVFAAPPSENWQQDKVKNIKDEPAVVRYSAVKDPNQFIVVSSTDMGGMTSWTDKSATEDLTRKLQNNIMKRSEAEIRQRETKLGGETALQLTFTYLEGTTRVWGSQVYAFHNKLLWNVSCSCPESERNGTEKTFNNILSTFEFQ